jgi:uncharacterized DUF497 family protein
MADIDIQELLWEPDINEAHIWERHHRTRAEVEEVCYGNPEYLKVEDAREGRIRVIGRRLDGRLLVIILAPQGNGVFYPVTAKPPNRQEIRRYEAWRKEKEQ